MKVTTKQKTYAGLVVLALAALGADRMFGGATAVEAKPAVAQLAADHVAAEAGAMKLDGAAARASSIALRLQSLAGAEPANLNTVSNAFVPSSAWAGARGPETDQRLVSAAKDFAGGHVLSAVMCSSRGGQAIINGQLVRQGQSVDGMKLVAIGPNSADLTNGAAQVELRMDPGQ